MEHRDPVAKNVLVDVCLHGMIEEYRVHLKNLFCASFSQLREATKKRNELFRRTMRFNLGSNQGFEEVTYGHNKKRMEELKSNSQKGSYNNSRYEAMDFPLLPWFPYGG